MFLNRAYRCISCKSKPNIKVKDNAYCNTCFTTTFLRKLKQNYRCVLNKPALIIHTGTMKSSVLVYALTKALYPYALKSIRVYSRNGSLVGYGKLEHFNHDIKTYQEYLECCHNISMSADEKVVLEEKSMDDIACDILYDILYANTHSLVEKGGLAVYKDDLMFVRPFASISDKEIAYFYFLYRSEIEVENVYVVEELKAKIRMFLCKISEANYSTVYNIIEMIRKYDAESKPINKEG
ncbi:hypothetical protein VCUG_00758 [Vavraia culicis subsp. floridensis]|uniref:Cytoplasmic tRNA 2-thiolation protein 2 n=1 Tax=Vavraia culicis (isolate floridensis) TaxID=948595 RepID=L2GWR8_VAVCU|nr:uncharacterized protein VCUG_00758 [Vavraia culicis subsp. floridensis]ELA47797.1 hypothetical protein VCUG_00758 [Vavraia culicis subsp. floridensis]